MKNIAIPLLVAGSAQAARPAGMEADVAAPQPWFGKAGLFHADGCTGDQADSTLAKNVKAKRDALKTVADALAGLKADKDRAKADGAKAIGPVESVRLAKVASDAAYKAAQERAVTDKALIDSANAAAEAERAAEGAEATAIGAKNANAAEVAKLAAAAKANYVAYKALNTDMLAYKASVTAASAHLAKERQELAVALCRLQPAAVGGKTWKARVGEQDTEIAKLGAAKILMDQTAAQAANAATPAASPSAADGGCLAPAVTAVVNGATVVRKAAEGIAAGGGYTAALATQSAKLTAEETASSAQRTKPEIVTFYTQEVFAADYARQVAAALKADAAAEETKAAAAVTMMKNLYRPTKTANNVTSDENDTTKWAAPANATAKTLWDAQAAFQTALANWAGAGQVKALIKRQEHSNWGTYPSGDDALGTFKTGNAQSANAAWTWYVAASALSAATKAYHDAAKDTYTGMAVSAGNEGNACGAATGQNIQYTADNAANADACKAACNGKDAYKVETTVNTNRHGLPDVKHAPADNTVTWCYGYQFHNSACKLGMETFMVAPGGSGAVSTACMARDKSTKAKDYVTAYEAVYGSGCTDANNNNAAIACTVAAPKAGSKEILMTAAVDADATVKAKALAFAQAENMLAVAYLAHKGVETLHTALKTSAEDKTSQVGTKRAYTADQTETAWKNKNDTLTLKKKDVTDIEALISSAQAAVDAQNALINGNTTEIAEMVKVLSLAQGDLKVQQQATAKALHTFVQSCDPATNDTAEQANPCVLGTLWDSLVALNSAFDVANTYTKPDVSKETNALTVARGKTAGLVKAASDAEAETAKKLKARTDISGATTQQQTDFLKDLKALRKTADDKLAALVAERGKLTKAIGDIATKQGEVDAAQKALDQALMDCKVAQYDTYSKALTAAQAKRTADLAAIEKLINDNPAPARGAAGARCEKALSNGTFRPARGAGTCEGENTCCGAARVPIGADITQGWMTIETCGSNAAGTKYAYRPPRAPLALTLPATTEYPFTCIQGAHKLAAAASALAAAVYMLA